MTAIERLLAEDIDPQEPGTWHILVPVSDLREVVAELKRLRGLLHGK